jgi:hypothetical protein
MWACGTLSPDPDFLDESNFQMELERAEFTDGERQHLWHLLKMSDPARVFWYHYSLIYSLASPSSISRRHINPTYLS